MPKDTKQSLLLSLEGGNTCSSFKGKTMQAVYLKFVPKQLLSAAPS